MEHMPKAFRKQGYGNTRKLNKTYSASQRGWLILEKINPIHSKLPVTLQAAPLKYNIAVGSDRQKFYNKNHKHLAYELRNIPFSKRSIKTDIFSIGYLFQSYFVEYLKNREFTKVTSKMVLPSPTTGPGIFSILANLKKINFKD